MITPVQQQMLDYIQERGTVVGLFGMTIDQEIDYSHAWLCLNRLEKSGLVLVERSKPGRRLRISAK